MNAANGQHPANMDDLRLAVLLQEYDELQAGLCLPDVLTAAHSPRRTHHCNDPCCRHRAPGPEPLRRVDSIAEYEAHMQRRLRDDRLLRRRQRVLEALVAEGMPAYLWIAAGEDRCVYLSRRGPDEEFLRTRFADPDGHPERAALEGELELVSVRREALDGIPPTTLPDDVEEISRELDRVAALPPFTRAALARYHLLAAFAVLLAVLLTPVDGAFLALAIGVGAMYLLLAALDRRLGPARVREKKARLWQRRHRLDRREALAHVAAGEAAAQRRFARRPAPHQTPP